MYCFYTVKYEGREMLQNQQTPTYIKFFTQKGDLSGTYSSETDK